MEAECNEDKMAEVYNAITGDFLTENPELGFNSALGPGKISKSLYKGLTPAMRQAIYDEQANQRAELKVYLLFNYIHFRVDKITDIQRIIHYLFIKIQISK